MTEKRPFDVNCNKLAAYLDEAGDEPAAACRTLVKHHIHYVVLRTAWTGEICNLTDQACKQLRQLLTEHNLSAITLITQLGNVDQDQLLRQPREHLDRAFNIASYFQAGFIGVHLGIHRKVPNDSVINSWAQLITERCLAANLTPLYEMTETAALREPALVAKFLQANRRWRLLYDPVQLIIRRNQDPFTRFWTLLKNQTAAIDIRDFKIGIGYKPVGFGDAKMALTLADLAYKGWYYLEPALGRRYGPALTKAETFALAVDALENILINRKQATV